MLETSPDPPLLLWFPELDPGSARTAMPVGALFVDPGVRTETSTRFWQPGNLPLSADLSQAFLRESARFAREHGRGRQGLAVAALTRDDFYAQTSLAIRAQLTASAQPQQANMDQAIQAQQTLLLAWQLEQQNLEIQALQQSIHAGWDDLAQVMGVDETDEMPSLAGEQDFFEDEFQALPWQMILEALLYFAPPEAVLTTCRKVVLEAFAEIETCVAEDCPEPILEQVRAALDGAVARLIRVPGWRLAGKTRCPGNKPWLAQSRMALLLGATANM